MIRQHATERELPDAVWEEAAIWHARMREPLMPAERRTEFDRWLAADASHAHAFHETVRLWAALERPVAQIMAEPAPVRRVEFHWRWAVAACMALFLLSGLWLQREWLDDWRADYVSGTGAKRAVLLDDGSEVVLNTATALAVDMTAEQRRVRLYRGEAWFNVARDAGRPFVVETAEGNVRVTGTRFNVRLADGGAVVSLAEGRVELSPEDESAHGMALVPGQQATLGHDAISAPTDFDPAVVGGWQRGQMVFYGAPLGEVVAELNRYRPGRIVVADGKLADLKVTGVFDSTHPDEALEVIRNTLPVRMTRLTGYLVLLR